MLYLEILLCLLCWALVIDLLLWLVLFAFILFFFYNLFFLSCLPDDFWIVCLYIAIDIDATGLDAEENDIPANHRSPKPSANSVTSPHSKEKRMPFFKKVTLTSKLPSAQLLNRTAPHFSSCWLSASFDKPITCMLCYSLFLFHAAVAKQKQRSVSLHWHKLCLSCHWHH